ncbi:MAG: hypothetical protein H7062_03340 [Candidatus Saccharimonas sp.]|nr:hypothetical protein [Planctomycetaceae bacterium]
MAGPVASGGNSPTETVSGLIVSLLFWFCLLLAASLFAAVALAPKLAETLRLRDLYTTNQLKLVSVERQNEQLQSVVDAIQNDKDFATEMTRIEFDAVRSDEEIIPVAADLKLETRGIQTPRAQPVIPRAWYQPWLTLLTENDSLRSMLLGAAAVLVVVSFTWFQPASADRLQKHVNLGRTAWQALRDRYTSQPRV